MKSYFAAVVFCIACSCCFSCTNSSTSAEKINGDTYQCLPCGRDCDNTSYNSDGTCSSCHMRLVKKSSVVFANIEASSICRYIRTHPDAVLLDVRTKEEFEGTAQPDFGRLKNAINLPIQQLEEKMGTIADLKNKEILVYCSHSHRSPQASYILTQNRFSHVTNMLGGMSVVTDKECKQ